MTRNQAIVGLAGAIAVVLLIAASPLVRVQGRSLGSLIGAASRVKGGDTVIATVNGEGITLSQLETTRAALQATSGSRIDDPTAYRQAMDYCLRNKALVQEARRRGLSVDEQEAREYMAKMKAEGDPEAARFMQDQAEAAGLSDREWEERAVAAYQEGLLIGKLYEALREETPRPTQEDIDLYLARSPGPNAIVVIPIAFDDAAAAAATYAELEQLATDQAEDEFVTTFVGYARRLGKREPGEFVHEKFHFFTEDELPDYARDALARPEGAMSLFERPDGTWIIYLVLKTVTTSVEEARAAAETQLFEERYAAYALQVEEQLKRQAKVEVFKDRLPADAAAAPADW